MITIRVIYSKTGPIRFISHLDLMRTIFRCFIRTGLPISLSKGFTPHQLIAFGPPLSVGMEGENEFFDFNLDQFCDLKNIANSLKYSFINLLDIKDIRYVDPAKDIFSKDIDLLSYNVFLDPRIKITIGSIEEFLSRKEIIVERVLQEKSKTLAPIISGRTKRIDLKPLISKLELKDGVSDKLISLDICSCNNMYANPYDVISALFNIDEHKARGFKVRRVNMYSRKKGVSINSIKKPETGHQ